MQVSPFRAVYPRKKLITSPDSFFGKVKEEYPVFRKSGFFKQRKQEGMYIYRIDERRRSYTGLLMLASMDDYEQGRIKIHEHTLATKEQRQIQLLLHRRAVVKPVLLTYRAVDAIDKIIKKLLAEKDPSIHYYFEEEDEHHWVWEIKEEKVIARLQQLFSEKVPQAYIADGHHRTAAMALLRSQAEAEGLPPCYDYLLSAFFPTRELDIFEFNRVVINMDAHSPAMLMARLSALAEIEILDTYAPPRQKHEWVLLLNREWFRLKWRKEILQGYGEEEVLLDVSLLNELVLHQILGIEDPRTDARLKYVEGPRGIEAFEQLVNKSEHRLGFVLHPVDIEDFLHIADMGKVLPPKSTWFEPRMRNGLLVHDLGREAEQTE